MKILEIGGGENPNPKTTIRMDVRFIPGKVDIVGNAQDLFMFNDNELDGIYARHVLEHWSFRLTEKILKEWYRAIKPGGYLEVYCPDIDKIIKCYQEGVVDHYTGRKFDSFLFSYYIYGDQTHENNFHKSGWNFESLKNLLIKAGFKSVERQPQQFEDHLEMRIIAKK